MKKEMCDNPNNDTRQQVRYNDKNRKTKKHIEIKDEKKNKKKKQFLIVSISTVSFIDVFLPHQHSK